MRGKSLQIERIRAGIKQYELADALSMDQSLLSKIENDRVTVTEEMEERYLRKLRELKNRS